MLKNPAEAYKSGQAALALLKKKQSVDEFKQNLTAFKQAVLTLPFIFSSPQSSQDKAAALRHRLLAAQGYEESVKFFASSSASSKEEAEELDTEVVKHLILLKPFYFDKLLAAENAKNKNRLEIIGLSLLNSLVNQQGRDFYTLLERLSPQERTDEYVKFVCQIEENLMEGNYGQLQKMGTSKSSKGFSKLFQRAVDKLEGTVQKEVVQCLEKAYTKISEKDAMAMLKTDSKKQKPKVPEAWSVQKGFITFNLKSDALKKKTRITNDLSSELIKDTVGVAKELERIV